MGNVTAFVARNNGTQRPERNLLFRLVEIITIYSMIEFKLNNITVRSFVRLCSGQSVESQLIK